MKKTKNRVPRAWVGVLAVLGLAGCGPRPEALSEAQWEVSRADSQRYAYLWARDFDYQGKAGDKFIFGANVTAVRGFVSAALTASLTPRVVSLKMTGPTGARKLNVVDAANRTLMAFDVGVREGYLEVDFGSAGNDVKLRQLVDGEGGRSTDGAASSAWQSTGAPRVLKIQQDNDTVVVDLVHTISQRIRGQDGGIATKAGEVTLRLFLLRQKAVPAVAAGQAKTVGQGKSLAIGFFGPGLGTGAAQPIQRFAAGKAAASPKPIHFYLKDVPAAFQDVAKEAVLSWNSVFDGAPITVSVAPADVDAGDPRTNVIKWFDGTDDTLGWAGVAKMNVDPATGFVVGGDVYIQGDTLLKLYRGVTGYTDAVKAGGLKGLAGTLANADLSFTEGEKPVIPFLTDVTQDFATYMQGYYKEVFAHEVGHVLGLRHNFAGSTALDAQGRSASVMDYAPRGERNRYDGPGFYDRAALRWAYYGEAPRQSLPFCTDENLWDSPTCNQGDWGDPMDHAIKSLVHATQLLAQKAVPIANDDVVSSVGTMVENALKQSALKAQLSSRDRARLDAELSPAYDFFFRATPAPGLSAADRQVVTANLARARAIAQKKVDELRGRGLIGP